MCTSTPKRTTVAAGNQYRSRHHFDHGRKAGTEWLARNSASKIFLSLLVAQRLSTSRTRASFVFSLDDDREKRSHRLRIRLNPLGVEPRREHRESRWMRTLLPRASKKPLQPKKKKKQIKRKKDRGNELENHSCLFQFSLPFS